MGASGGDSTMSVGEATTDDNTTVLSMRTLPRVLLMIPSMRQLFQSSKNLHLMNIVMVAIN